MIETLTIQSPQILIASALAKEVLGEGFSEDIVEQVVREMNEELLKKAS